MWATSAIDHNKRTTAEKHSSTDGEGDEMVNDTSSDKLLHLPTDRHTTSKQFRQFLHELQGDTNNTNKPFVFQRLVAYKDRKSSKRWKPLYNGDCESEFCATVKAFWREKKMDKKAWFGLATLPPTSWVGTPVKTKSGKRKRDPKLDMWHAVAFGVIKKETSDKRTSKVLIIYDSDIPDINTSEDGAHIRARDVLRHQTIVFLWTETVKKCSDAELFVNNPKKEECGKNQCVKLANYYLRKWVNYGNKPFEGDEDPRLEGGFHRITYK